MRRLAVILTLIVAPPLLCHAQEGLSVAEVFVEASPQVLFPTLTQANRENLIATYEAVQAGEVRESHYMNALGGQSEVKVLSRDYMRVQVDAKTLMELKLFDKPRGGQLLGMSVTHLEPPKQSVVRFYTPVRRGEWVAWDPVALEEVLAFPETKDYFIYPESIHLREVKNALMERGTLHYEAHFHDTTRVLTLRVTTFDDPVAAKLHPKVSELLLEGGINYFWRGHRFEKLIN